MDRSTGLEHLTETLTPITDTQLMSALLDDLLTPAELQEIGERLLIFKLLKAGHTQREVAQQLGVSVTTVNRGARMLKW